ncbi:Inactive dipeptidyl peptidase 10 [Halotydeus destructor]|nr:Inactive dipeptidyl peptidase 10 [Halotydeus destructor]
MDKLTLISGGLFLAADIFAIISIVLPDWIVSDVGGDTRLGLLQSCITLYGRKSHCYVPVLETEWMVTLILIILGCLCVTGAVILLVLSSWNARVITHARWTGFAAMILFCLAAVIFPMGFTELSIGGEAYQLPSSHQVGVSYIFFVLSLWVTVVSELFAGKDLAVEDEEKNWKGICIAVMVILTIIALIVTAIVILTPNDTGPRIKHPRISLEDIVSKEFQPKQMECSWISDTEVVYKNSDGALVIYNVIDNSTHTAVPNSTLRQYNVEKFSVSNDKRYILLVHEIKKLYQYSYTAKYKIYNVSSEHVFPLEGPDQEQELQHAEWGPSSSQLVFVHRNNIYYHSAMSEQFKPLVTTGREGVLANGVPDWLYGEKILKTNKALWWSQDGAHLAYLTIDDSAVDSMAYPKYGTYDDASNVYPEMVTLKYPKAGRSNPKASLFVIDLQANDSQPKAVMPPAEIQGRDHYFAALSWMARTSLAVVWMRREQNYSVVSLCSSDRSWACEKHVEEKMDSGSTGWIELFEGPLGTSDGKYYFLRLPMNDGELGAFRQIAMITINGGLKNFLTQDAHDVTKILAHSNESRTVYYEATLAGQPGERHIFRIPDILSPETRTADCLTCNVTERNCSFHEATFSPKVDYFVLKCLGPSVPWTEIRTVADNEIRQFPTLDHTCPLYAFLTLSLTSLPDPGDQGVSHKFAVDWALYLASTRNYIYARIDVRGSRYQGDRLLHETWHKLGSVEVDDYLKVVKYLKEEYLFIDLTKTAIWGSAYGGYLAASALIADHSPFNCTIAVAPVTNWMYVDSFTAERYFGQPSTPGNYMHYAKADICYKADNFKGRHLFLIHGTADDAVHLQHSFAFMKSLNEAGVMYKSQLYPDSNHYLDDVKHHFYRSMDTYLLDCFKLEEGQDIIEMQTNPKAHS